MDLIKLLIIRLNVLMMVVLCILVFVLSVACSDNTEQVDAGNDASVDIVIDLNDDSNVVEAAIEDTAIKDDIEIDAQVGE